MHSDEMSSNNPVPKIPMMTQSQDCIPTRTDSAFFSCLSKSLVLQTKKPERRCPRVWRHRQMPHQHSFCKGEQAMSESFNTIPCLRMQPTSMLFSMEADHLSRRGLFGNGFIMLCCEDWDIDYHQCPNVYTTETMEKHLEKVVRPNGSFLDSTELSELSGLHWVLCWDIPLSSEQRTAILCGYFRFGIVMGKFLARDSDESPICVVDVLRGGERLKVYDWFTISTAKTPQRLYLSISQILELCPFGVVKKSFHLKVKDVGGLHTSLPYTFSKYYHKLTTPADRSKSVYYLVDIGELPDSFKEGLPQHFKSCAFFPYSVLKTLGFPECKYLENVISRYGLEG